MKSRLDMMTDNQLVDNQDPGEAVFEVVYQALIGEKP